MAATSSSAAVSSAAATIGRSAAVLGATGAVGEEVVRALLKRGWGSVHLLNRREVADTPLTSSPKVTQHVVPMEDGAVGGPLETSCAEILQHNRVDAVFVTMGVGAPSKTKGKAGADLLKRVDVDLPTACARGAKQAESVKHVSLLTAVGADINAVPAKSDRLFGLIPQSHAGGGLYNHCKGQVEENMRAMDFASFSTFRPATLVGSPNTPAAVGFIARLIDPMLPAKWKSSQISTLGEAMVLDAEDKLSPASSGSPPEAAKFSIFEGSSLLSLYSRIMEESASGSSGETKDNSL